MWTNDNKQNLGSNLAAIYVRVSTKAQGGNTSTGVQWEESINYAMKKDLVVNDNLIYIETESASATKNDYLLDSLDESLENRPKLREILNLAQSRQFSHLIVYSRSRLTRSVDQFLKISALLKKYNITLHYSRPGESIDTNDEAMGRFIELILSSVDEYEVNIISRRVTDGMLACVRQGYWPGGRVPFGYISKDTDSRHTVLMPSIYQAHLVEEVFGYYKEGKGYTKIAELMKEKYKAEGINWTKSKIRSIIKNENYTMLTWNRRKGRRNKGEIGEPIKVAFRDSSPIIDADTWNGVNEISAKKQILKDPKYYCSPFLLKGKLICAKCGEMLVCKNNGRNKKSVYRCPTKNEGISELIVEKDQIEHRTISLLEKSFIENNIDFLWKQYSERYISHIDRLSEVNKDINQRITNISKLISNIDFMLEKNMDQHMVEILASKRTELVSSITYFTEERDMLVAEVERRCYYSKVEFNMLIKQSDTFQDFISTQAMRMILDIYVDKMSLNLIDDEVTIDITVNA